MKNKSCCCSDSSCCDSNAKGSLEKRKIIIDFLYLDLEVCTPCKGTEDSLQEAIKDVSKVLEATGVEVVVNNINITNEEQAIIYKLEGSPTICINGIDIQLEVRETSCASCSDLSGIETACRVWIYQGKEYNVPPKAMIIEALLRAVYGNNTVNLEGKDYSLPDNLKRFFAAIHNRKL